MKAFIVLQLKIKFYLHSCRNAFGVDLLFLNAKGKYYGNSVDARILLQRSCYKYKIQFQFEIQTKNQ